MKKMAAISAAVISLALALTACSSGKENSNTETDTNTNTVVTQSSVEEAAAKSNIVTDVKVELDEFDRNTEWSDSAAIIKLDGKSVSTEGSGVQTSAGNVTISAAGDYVFSGEASDTQIIVDAADAKVHLILNGADITSKSSAPIYVKNADKAVITLASGTTNTLTDSEDASYADSEAEEPNATVFSKDDLTINGDGKLVIDANFNNGINSKDDLYIAGGDITVDAKNNGIKGKDTVYIALGSLDVTTSEGDGIQSYNSGDGSKGFTLIEGGSIKVDSGDNALQAETTLAVKGGTLELTSANNGMKSKFYIGISENSDISVASDGDGIKAESEDASAGYIAVSGGKLDITAATDGIQAVSSVDISDGDITIVSGGGSTVSSKVHDSGWGDWGGGKFGRSGTTGSTGAATASDGTAAKPELTSSTATSETASAKGIKSAGDLTVSGGTLTLDTSDDCLHCANSLTVSGGTLSLKSGDDGMHADTELLISDGKIDISESYEGIESALITVSGGDIKVNSSDDGFNVAGGNDSSSMGGRPGENSFNASDDGKILTISGGNIYVNADGDGLDSNGSIVQSGGTVYVDGPTNDGNGALDYNSSYTKTGGSLVAAGSSGMAQAISDGSSDYCLSVGIGSSAAGGTEVRVVDGDGNEVLSYTPSKTFSNVVVSLESLEKGKTYTVYSGDDEVGSAEVSATVTTIGTATSGMGGFGGRPGGDRPDKGQNGNMTPPDGVPSDMTPPDGAPQQ